ncbi:hypothetical protein OURE66S_03754 [Oligella ureolytica]
MLLASPMQGHYLTLDVPRFSMKVRLHQRGSGSTGEIIIGQAVNYRDARVMCKAL